MEEEFTPAARPPTASSRAPWRWALLSLAVTGLLGVGWLVFQSANTSHQRFEEAKAALRQGKYDEAIACCDEVIAQHPRAAEVYATRGLAYLGKKEYHAALADFSDALRIEPKDALSFGKRGFIHHELGSYEQAVADLSEAIRLSPQTADYHLQRGNARAVQQHYEPALTDYTRAIVLDPKLADAYSNRGLVYFAQGNYARAIVDHTDAIRLKPGWAEAHVNRGQAHYKKKDYPQALADHEEALRLEPKLVRALNNLAWFRATCPDEKVRDGKQAVAYAVQAHKLSVGKDPAVLSTLAAAHAEVGDFDQALHWQRQIIDMAQSLSLDDLARAQNRLRVYEERKPYREE